MQTEQYRSWVEQIQTMSVGAALNLLTLLAHLSQSLGDGEVPCIPGFIKGNDDYCYLVR